MHLYVCQCVSVYVCGGEGISHSHHHHHHYRLSMSVSAPCKCPGADASPPPPPLPRWCMFPQQYNTPSSLLPFLNISASDSGGAPALPAAAAAAGHGYLSYASIGGEEWGYMVVLYIILQV